MSTAELKKIVDESTDAERQFLRDYLAARYPEDFSTDPKVLDQRMREMDEGKFVTWDELVAAHERLKAEGR